MNKNELTPEQYQAIEKFSKGLKEVFTNYKAHHHDKFSDIVLDYVMKIIDIHLQLAELDVARYLDDMEKAMSK